MRRNAKKLVFYSLHIIQYIHYLKYTHRARACQLTRHKKKAKQFTHTHTGKKKNICEARKFSRLDAKIRGNFVKSIRVQIFEAKIQDNFAKTILKSIIKKHPNGP